MSRGLVLALSLFAVTQPSRAYDGTWVRPPSPGAAVAGEVQGFGNNGGPLGGLAVCRGATNGASHPGKVWPGKCNFEYGWADVVTPDYQVLQNDPKHYQWVNSYNGTYGSHHSSLLPSNAVIGGYADDGKNTPMGVCQASVPEDKTVLWHPGKYYEGYCNIAWSGGGPVSKDRKRRVPDGNGAVQILVWCQDLAAGCTAAYPSN